MPFEILSAEDTELLRKKKSFPAGRTVGLAVVQLTSDGHFFSYMNDHGEWTYSVEFETTAEYPRLFCKPSAAFRHIDRIRRYRDGSDARIALWRSDDVRALSKYAVLRSRFPGSPRK